MYFVTYLKTVSTAIRTSTKTKITVEWNLGKTAGFLSQPFLLQSMSTCFKPGFLREIGGKKAEFLLNKTRSMFLTFWNKMKKPLICLNRVRCSALTKLADLVSIRILSRNQGIKNPYEPTGRALRLQHPNCLSAIKYE